MFTASQPGWHLRGSKITSRSFYAFNTNDDARAVQRPRLPPHWRPWIIGSLFQAHTGRSDIATAHMNLTSIIKRDSCFFFFVFSFLKKKKGLELWPVVTGNFRALCSMNHSPEWIFTCLQEQQREEKKWQFSTSSSAFAQLHVGASSKARTGTDNELK